MHNNLAALAVLDKYLGMFDERPQNSNVIYAISDEPMSAEEWRNSTSRVDERDCRYFTKVSVLPLAHERITQMPSASHGPITSGRASEAVVAVLHGKQVARRVHLSGGVGSAAQLEPPPSAYRKRLQWELIGLPY